MPFSLPKPALAAAQLPDFAADTPRKPDVGAQTSSAFDAILSRHKAQADTGAKIEGAKPQAATHESHKTKTSADTRKADAGAKPHKTAEKSAAKATSKPADDKTIANSDDAQAPEKPAQTDDASQTAAATTQATTDTVAQPDATAATQADAATATAKDAAVFDAQAATQASLQAAAQPQPQTQAPAQDNADDAQLSALLPMARPMAKGPQQPAPAPQDAAATDASTDATSTDPKATPTDFAALLGTAAGQPAAAPASAQAPAPGSAPVPTKPGRAVTEKIVPAASLNLPLSAKAATADVPAAGALAKAVPDMAANPNSTSSGGDQPSDPRPGDRFADVRDAAQDPTSLQANTPQAQPQITAQTFAQIADTAATATPKQPDGASQAAFSIQTAADVPGGYSASGAQTGFSAASATTLSRAAIENMGTMGVQIAKKLSEGTTKFALELHPADLGKVEVALNIDRDGKTTAHLRFDSPVTAAAFSANEGELRQQLANAGLQLDNASLSFSSRDGDGGQGFAQMFQGQEQASQGQAARALKTASDQADQVDANTALDAALAEFRNRPVNSTLALNLVV